MAAAHDDTPPTFHRESPSPEFAPTPALGACPELSRCLSTASTASHGSATTDASNIRESLGSDLSAGSRQSSASYQSPRRSDVSAASTSRYSTGSLDGPPGRTTGGGRRRGFMRPQATDFAASAKQRESVLSLGSISHLQHYFARTGLLDGKGAQLARKRQQKAQTLDLSSLEASSFLAPQIAGSDVDSSYASMGSSPDLGAQIMPSAHVLGSDSVVVESPIEEHPPGDTDDGYYLDEYEELDANVLPPTTSTYNYRDKPVPKPPSIAELKSDLTTTLADAATALKEAKAAQQAESAAFAPPGEGEGEVVRPAMSPGWYEIQGMHILDVMTLAIRAAKVYYTSHEQPDRLDAIKSEKALRSELLAVMDVLRRMATRGFAGGLRDEETAAMQGWIDGLHGMLRQEEDMEAAEAAERAGWTWLRPEGWEGRGLEREYAFLQSLLRGVVDTGGAAGTVESLPPWTPIDRTSVAAAAATATATTTTTTTTTTIPAPDAQQQGSVSVVATPFLRHLQDGRLLVQLHNAAVRKSKRRFGAIPTWHADTQKPYRCADNLRYWTKAAELRWEVLLKIDALGIVYDSGPQVWLDFEDALLKWCAKVREEIAAEVQTAGV